MSSPAIRVDGVTKRFGGVAALDDVTLSFAGGRVHAIVGENGAGKSTLARILAGRLHPDAGTLEVAGRQVRHATPALMQSEHGVALVPQELDVCADMSVAQNIWLGREQRIAPGVVSRRAMRAATRDLLDRLGVELDPNRRVGELPPALQQLTLVARAVSRDARVLILDEPTAVLEVQEARRLLEFLRRLRDEGRTILYVSHRMPEIFAVADEVHVLRDGRHVASRPASELDERALVAQMVGRELAHERRAGHGPSRADDSAVPALRVRALSGPGVEDVSFDVRPGEVVGLAGLPGCGRTELLDVIFGARRRTGGEVEIAGRALAARKPADAMAAGIGYVPGERLRQGVVGGLSIATNVAIADLPAVSRFGIVRRKRLEELAREAAGEVDVRYRALGQPIRTLSGGNQQKVLLARWIRRRPAVLLLDEPTRGVDVGAKAEIYRIIRDLGEAGVGVVLSSSELPELLGECDRILVMAEGRVVGELDAAAADEQSVLALALDTRPEETELLTTGGAA